MAVNPDFEAAVRRAPSYEERLRLHQDRVIQGAIECLADAGWTSMEVRAAGSVVERVLHGRHPVAFGEVTRVALVDGANPKRLSASPELLAMARTADWAQRLKDVSTYRAVRRALWVVGEALVLGYPDLEALLAELDGLH